MVMSLSLFFNDSAEWFFSFLVSLTMSVGSNFILGVLFMFYFKGVVRSEPMNCVFLVISIILFMGCLAGSYYLIIVLVANLKEADAANTWFFTFFSAWFSDTFLITGLIYLAKISIFNNYILQKT